MLKASIRRARWSAIIMLLGIAVLLMSRAERREHVTLASMRSLEPSGPWL